MPRGGACAYCGAPAVHTEHVVPRSAYKRLRGKEPPRWFFETERACLRCNVAKMTRLLIPPSWSSRLDELNALGIGTFRVWHGDVESLRTVVK